MANIISYDQLFNADVKKGIDELTASIASLDKQMSQMVDKAKTLKVEMEKANPVTKEQQQSTAALANEITKLEKRLALLTDARNKEVKDLYLLREQAKEAARVQQLLAKEVLSAEGSTAKLSAQLSLLKIALNSSKLQAKQTETIFREFGNGTREQATKRVKELTEQIKLMDAAMGDNRRNVGNYKSAFDGLGKQMGSFKTAMVSMVAAWVGWYALISKVVGIFKDSIKTIVEFEKNLSSLQAVVGASGKAMEELSNQAIALSRNTRYLATDIVKAQEAMARLGLTADEIKASTQAVLDFSLATGGNVTDAAQLAVNAMNIFGANANEVNKYVSSLTISTYRSALSFGYLQTALSTVAPVARQFGFSLEDTLALLGTLANSGFRASEAATATRNIILKLADANGKLAKTLKEPVTDLPSLVAGLKDLDERGVDLYTTLDLVKTRSAAAFSTFIKGADDILQLRDAVTDVNDEFKDVVDTMDNNVAGSIKHIQSSWEALVLAFQNSTGVFKDVLDWVDRIIQRVNATLLSINEVRKQEVALRTGDAQTEVYKQGGAAEQYKQRYKTTYENAIKAGKTQIEAMKAAQKEVLPAILAEQNRLAGQANKLYDKVNKETGGIWGNIAYKGSQTADLLSTLYPTAFGQFAQVRGFSRAAQAITKQAAEFEATANVYAELYKELKSYDPTVIQEVTDPLTGAGDDKKPNKHAQAERERQTRALISEMRRELEEWKKAQKERIEVRYDGLEKELELNRLEREYGVKRVDNELRINEISIANLKDYKGFSEEVIKEMQLSKADIIQKTENEIYNIRLKYQIKEEELVKQTTDYQLKAVREGTQQQYALQIKSLEQERKIALEKAQLARQTGEPSQSDTDILAVYERKRMELEEQHATSELQLMQDLENSRFNLIEQSENKAFKLKKQHEIELMVLRLRFMEADPQSRPEEIEILRNQIATAQRELKPGNVTSLWDALGLNLSKQDQQNLDASIGYIMDALNEIADAQVEAAQRVVEARQKEAEAAQSALDKELEARANGYANNVTLARKELEEKKRLEQKAIQDQKRAQRQKAAIQTLDQISNLVTATALLWSQQGIFAPIAIATMWASFAASKVIAANMANQSTEEYGEGTVELLQGGSHQSGNDIDLGTKPDGTKRRAEGGEFFAVINKRNSRKFRNEIPDVINSLNNGTFLNKYTDANSRSAAVALNVSMRKDSHSDLSRLERDVAAIKAQNDTKVYSDGSGNTITTYKNVKTTVRK